MKHFQIIRYNNKNGFYLKPVYFGSGSTELSSKAEKTLRSNAAIIKAYLPQYTIKLEGLCDRNEAQLPNTRLGKSRAEAVKKFLVTEGVSENQLEIIDLYDTMPAAYGEDEKFQAKNRRVEFYIAAEGSTCEKNDSDSCSDSENCNGDDDCPLDIDICLNVDEKPCHPDDTCPDSCDDLCKDADCTVDNGDCNAHEPDICEKNEDNGCIDKDITCLEEDSDVCFYNDKCENNDSESCPDSENCNGDDDCPLDIDICLNVDEKPCHPGDTCPNSCDDLFKDADCPVDNGDCRAHEPDICELIEIFPPPPIPPDWDGEGGGNSKDSGGGQNA
jgi:hypothetical protein